MWTNNRAFNRAESFLTISTTSRAVDVGQSKLSASDCRNFEGIHSSHRPAKFLALCRPSYQREGQGTIFFLIDAPLLIVHSYNGCVIDERPSLRRLRDDHSSFNRKVVAVTKKPNPQRFVGEFNIDSVSIASTGVWEVNSGWKRSRCSCGNQIVSSSSSSMICSTGIPARRA